MTIENENIDDVEQNQIDKENTAFSSEDSEEVKDDKTEDKPDEQEEKATEKAIEASKKLDEQIDADEDDEIVKPEETKKDTDETSDGKDSAEKSGKKGEEDDTTSKTGDDKTAEKKVDDVVIDDDLIERAVRNGLTMKQAKAFGDASVLESTLTLMESKSAASEQTEKKDTGKDTEKTVEELKFEALELVFENVDDLDPELVAKVKAINEHNSKNMEAITKVVNELRVQLSEKTQSDNDTAVDKILNEIENLYSDLGDDYKDLIGKGSTTGLAKGSTQAGNRQKVIEAMRAIDIVDSGNKVSKTTKELFNGAIKQVFSDKQVELTNKKVAKTVTERNEQAINNPSGKTKAAPTGDEAAIQTSKEFDKKVDESDD